MRLPPPDLQVQAATDSVVSLVEALHAGRLCPVIGSGACVDLKIPTWRELIKQLSRGPGIQEARPSRSRVLPEGEGRSAGDNAWEESLERVLNERDVIQLYDLLSLDAIRLRQRVRRVLYQEGSPGGGESEAGLDVSETPLCRRPRYSRSAQRWIDPRDNIDSRDKAADGQSWPSEDPFELKTETSARQLALLSCLVALEKPSRDFHALTYNVDTCLEEEIVGLGFDAVAEVETRTGRRVRILWKPRGQARAVKRLKPPKSLNRPPVRIFHPHGVVLRSEVGRALGGGASNTSGMKEKKDQDLELGLGDVSISFEELDRDRGWIIKEQPFPEDPVELGLVFGRKDYNQLFGSLTDRRNQYQLAAFHHLTCLFYGFSFADPNVDRLLDVAAELWARAEPQNAWRSGRPDTFGFARTAFHRSSDSRRDGRNPRHIALLKQPDELEVRRPEADVWTPEVDFFRREVFRLRRLGIEVLAQPTFLRKKYFIVDLIRRACGPGGPQNKPRHDWPGSW